MTWLTTTSPGWDSDLLAISRQSRHIAYVYTWLLLFIGVWYECKHITKHHLLQPTKANLAPLSAVLSSRCSITTPWPDCVLCHLSIMHQNPNLPCYQGIAVWFFYTLFHSHQRALLVGQLIIGGPSQSISRYRGPLSHTLKSARKLDIQVVLMSGPIVPRPSNVVFPTSLPGPSTCIHPHLARRECVQIFSWPRRQYFLGHLPTLFDITLSREDWLCSDPHFSSSRKACTMPRAQDVNYPTPHEALVSLRYEEA